MFNEYSDIKGVVQGTMGKRRGARPHRAVQQGNDAHPMMRRNEFGARHNAAARTMTRAAPPTVRTTPTTRPTMKALYPASHDIPRLNESALALKIARHSHCSTCNSCFGLRPPPDVAVELDDASDVDDEMGKLASYRTDENEHQHGDYLHSCRCGHAVTNHGADKAALGQDEFIRRAKAAVRLDEFLQVSISSPVDTCRK